MIHKHVILWATSWENLFMIYANNKGADQPVHRGNLISTFVVHCQDSIIPSYWILNSRPWLVSVAEQAGLSLTWSQTPKTGFLMMRLISRTWSHLHVICDMIWNNKYWQERCNYKWAAAWQNLQNELCAQRRLRSVWASTQSDQSSLCTKQVAKDPRFLHAVSEDWSDWEDAQADPSLCWGHRSFCWFCHAAAHVHGIKDA